MFPFLAIALQLFPKLVASLTDAKTVSNANDIKQFIDSAVKSISGATTPDKAREVLTADPSKMNDLKIRLAEISLEAQKLDVAEIQEYNRAANESTVDARENLLAMLSKPDSMWISMTPAIISYIVVIGFVVLIGLLLFTDPPVKADTTVLQIINICIGAVAAGFATVLNFWLGSSLGSRRKDTASSLSSTINQVRDLTTPNQASASVKTPDTDTEISTSDGGVSVTVNDAGNDANSAEIATPRDIQTTPLPASLVGIGRSTDPSTVNVRMDIPQGADRIPASIRYHNPGAQYPSREAAQFGQLGYGIIGGGHKIATFPSPVNGAASNFDLLFRRYTGMSIGAAGTKWTGANGFGVPGYDSNLLIGKGMIEQPDQAIALLKAIAGRESGKDDALTPEQWSHAHAMFRAGSADRYLAQFQGQMLPLREAIRPDDPPDEQIEILIVEALKRLGYVIDTNPDEVNIVYVEGMNEDGSVNNDEANKFNDLRCVIGFRNGVPAMLGKWQATTEPGFYYGRDHPINRLGAARIKFGQYSAWKVGIHRNTQEALVQVKDVTVCRDLNRDMERKGDTEDTGLFGINQHGGYDQPSDDIGKASAGCLVGRLMSGHRAFMETVKGDPRYLADQDFVFRTAILQASDVA
ncbi:hypothetical protein QO002_004279 [Pararhizobium capsulatum DSM 1112]|uniref:Uncharacterized protein n=1 Tax=Pararhizobium capsulatum DSM 1112 TaxID=1121113 RepID=A0ABU0BVU9_9HYPH|nr:hypothetical protein [Pararhizobium capsulatum]MDQ0322073.1 hypothetical protein [Pararhizobium capsulatum DSM 1112]